MQHNKVGELKLLSLFGHFKIILLLSLLFGTLSAKEEGSFSNFKKSQAAAFESFKDERDNRFNNYLKQQFTAFKVYKGTPLYKEAKPRKITPVMPVKIKPVGPKVTVAIKKPPKKKTPSKSEEKAGFDKDTSPKMDIIVIKPEVKEAKSKDLYINYFGSELGFNIPRGVKQANFYPQNQQGIVGFFGTAASSEHIDLIDDIKRVSKDMKLNDWGVYLLVLQISNSIFSDSDNSKLLSWFIFNKLGYAVKIGLVDRHVVLMHYSKKIIYSTPSYKFSNKRYYVISNYDKGSMGRLFSYKQDYPNSTKELDLSMNKLPLFKLDKASKTLGFEQFGNKYTLEYDYNKNLIDFMMTYPQADYETYFNAPLDEITHKTISAGMKKYIDGKKASEAMNFVLSFVQKSFEYETDSKQFSREKPMFAQETLYYDKSDCEDRAALFAYLIKELFHVPVIGLKYKDHMSTAIYIPMKGDKVVTRSRSFVVADPTYINANIGMSIPKYRSIKPEKYISIKKRDE